MKQEELQSLLEQSVFIDRITDRVNDLEVSMVKLFDRMQFLEKRINEASAGMPIF